MSDKLSDDPVALVRPKQPTCPTVATYQHSLISKRNSFLYVGTSFYICSNINLNVMRKTYSRTELKIKYKFITWGAKNVM